MLDKLSSKVAFLLSGSSIYQWIYTQAIFLLFSSSVPISFPDVRKYFEFNSMPSIFPHYTFGPIEDITKKSLPLE